MSSDAPCYTSMTGGVRRSNTKAMQSRCQGQQGQDCGLTGREAGSETSSEPGLALRSSLVLRVGRPMRSGRYSGHEDPADCCVQQAYRFGPLTPHLWVDLAINGWVIPPPSYVLEQSSTVPRVSGGFDQYEPLVGIGRPGSGSNYRS